MAHIGAPAVFEVLTAFVGNGAGINIIGHTEDGKQLGKIKGQIYNNRYVGEFDIPDNLTLDDHIYFEVNIPDNELSAESDHIAVRPRIEVTNLKWSAQDARRGDVITLSANVSEVVNDTEAQIVIYEYDRNNIHDKIATLNTLVVEGKIEVDWEYQYYEDTDEIPTNDELHKYGRSYNPPEYFFIIEIATQRFGEKQESGLLKFCDSLQIRVVGSNGLPLCDTTLCLIFPDGNKGDFKTDNFGFIRIDNAPPGKYELESDDYQLTIEV
ncbi:MAG: hypothetical protein NT002_00950 [candidate division Zixibacteria bacterium]|nr:hypothetical protein [candidate division Zixibacteria bacterium]